MEVIIPVAVIGALWLADELGVARKLGDRCSKHSLSHDEWYAKHPNAYSPNSDYGPDGTGYSYGYKTGLSRAEWIYEKYEAHNDDSY